MEALGQGTCVPVVLVNRKSRGQPSRWETCPEMSRACVEKTLSALGPSGLDEF